MSWAGFTGRSHEPLAEGGDLAPDRKTLALEACEGGPQVACGSQMSLQGHDVAGRLADPHRGMGSDHEGRVADQGHATAHHGRRLIVENALDRRRLLGRDGPCERRRQKPQGILAQRLAPLRRQASARQRHRVLCPSKSLKRSRNCSSGTRRYQTSCSVGDSRDLAVRPGTR